MHRILLIISLACLLLLSGFVLLRSADAPPTTPPHDLASENPPTPLTPDAPAAFAQFRNDAALTGIATASARLPDAPELLWTFTASHAISAQVAVSTRHLYVGSHNHTLYALDRANGKPVWTFTTEGAIETTPLITANTLVFGAADEYVYALNRATGELRWKTKTDDEVLSSPNLYTDRAGKQWVIVGSNDYRLYCFELTTGAVRWQYKTENLVNAAPAIVQDTAIFGGCDGFLHLVNLATGVAQKKIEIGEPLAASAAVLKNRAYVGHMSHAFVAIDLTTGKTAWEFRAPKGAIFASAAVNDAHVVFSSRDKRVYCLDPQTGAEHWRFATGGKVDSAPVIVGKRVIVGSEDGYVYMLDLASGAKIWKYETGIAISAPAAIVDGIIYIGDDDGNLYAFGEK